MKHKVLVIFVLYGSCLFGTDRLKKSLESLYYETYAHSDFVIRWQYQSFCDHIYDPRTDLWRWPTDEDQGVTFDPRDVEPGDLVFVRMFDTFFSDIHPKITVPYCIVSAGECLDKMMPEHKKYLDQETIIAWFGVHADATAMSHPKFYPLPLGIEQRPEYYEDRDSMNKYFKKLRTTTEKKYWVYMNFAFADKPERKDLHRLMCFKPFVHRGERKPFNEYLHEMAQCKFAFSPAGLGPDCYRTWEALLVGTIPIVRSSYLDPLYEDLPVLIVDSWEEINESFLEKAYRQICSKKYDLGKLYTTFWLQKIKKIQKNFFKKT